MERIFQFFTGITVAPFLTRLMTGSPQIVTEMANQEMSVNTVNLLINSITTVITVLGVAYIQAKFKTKPVKTDD